MNSWAWFFLGAFAGVVVIVSIFWLMLVAVGKGEEEKKAPASSEAANGYDL